MKFSRYILFARAFPALLCLPPFSILHFYALRPVLGEFWGELISLTVISDITIGTALFFLLMQFERMISKEIENKMYKNGMFLPTTNHLLHSDQTYSAEYKNKIHQKIKLDFDIDIPTLESERIDITKSRHVIDEAVGQIRSLVKKGYLVDQHNTEYGFIRNLSGGSYIAFILSATNVLVFSFLIYNQSALLLSFITAVFYGIILIFYDKLINKAADDYAKILIQEYMQKQK